MLSMQLQHPSSVLQHFFSTYSQSSSDLKVNCELLKPLNQTYILIINIIKQFIRSHKVLCFKLSITTIINLLSDVYTCIK